MSGPTPNLVKCLPLRVASLDLGRFHLIAVIGRDILNDLVLTYDGPARIVTLKRP